MARDAQTLAVLHGVAITTLRHRRDVIGLSLPLVSTDAAAGLALPRIPCEHGLTPRPVPLVTVATLGRARAVGVITTTAARQSGGLMGGDALWHG